MEKSDFSWMDAPTPTEGVSVTPTPTAPIMQRGAQDGKDRIWWCDGEHVWFRRGKSNPATLQRHNRFVADGDYEYIRTDDDVELYKLREQSRFAIKQKKTINLAEFDFWNVQRLAAKAACKRDWQQFADIVAYLRDCLNQNVGENTELRWTQQWADMKFAEVYEYLMSMVRIRLGPSPQEINHELAALSSRKGVARGRIVTVG